MSTTDSWVKPVSILSIEKTRGFEPVQVFTATIPAPAAGRLLKVLSARYPLGPLLHLKRIRRITSSDSDTQPLQLEVILSSTSTSVESDYTDILSGAGVPDAPIQRRLVSRHRPATRDQFESWKTEWPMSFHPPAESDRTDQFSDTDMKIASIYMQKAHEIAQSAQQAGNRAIGAVIVDPKSITKDGGTGIVVASAGDARTTDQPLAHAVMRCIDAVARAERDRRSCRSQSPTPKTNHEEEDTDVPIHAGEKRKHAQADNIDVGRASNSGYLCTGLDLYVTHEPCTMCSMALVHSRIRRVVFGEYSSTGALSTSHQIHVHPNMNHHFTVFGGFVRQSDESTSTEIKNKTND